MKHKKRERSVTLDRSQISGDSVIIVICNVKRKKRHKYKLDIKLQRFLRRINVCTHALV